MSKAVTSILNDHELRGGLSMTDRTMSLDHFTSFTGDRKESLMKKPSAHTPNRENGVDFTAVGRMLPLSGVIPSATAG